MAPGWTTRTEPECFYTWTHVAVNDDHCMYCGRRMDQNSTETYSNYGKAAARRPKTKKRKPAKGIPNPYNRHAKNYDPHAARFA